MLLSLHVLVTSLDAFQYRQVKANVRPYEGVNIPANERALVRRVCILHFVCIVVLVMSIIGFAFLALLHFSKPRLSLVSLRDYYSQLRQLSYLN